MEFADKYGLFGFLTVLSATSQFVDDEAVYLAGKSFHRGEITVHREISGLFFTIRQAGFQQGWGKICVE